MPRRNAGIETTRNAGIETTRNERCMSAEVQYVRC